MLIPAQDDAFKLPRRLQQRAASNLQHGSFSTTSPSQKTKSIGKKNSFLDRKGCTYDDHEHYWAQVDDEEEEEDHC